MKSNKAACSPLQLKALTGEDTTKVNWKGRRRAGGAGGAEPCSAVRKNFPPGQSFQHLGEQEGGNEAATPRDYKVIKIKSILSHRILAGTEKDWWKLSLLLVTVQTPLDSRTHGSTGRHRRERERHSRDLILSRVTSWSRDTTS